MFRGRLVAPAIVLLTLLLAAGGCTSEARSKISSGAGAVGDGLADSAKDVGGKLAVGAEVVGEELSDGWLTTKIKAQIGVTRLFGVKVVTTARVVTLSGEVKTPEERAAIYRLARDTKGVKDVTDLMVVAAQPPQ